jgi:Diacylglycerol kinase catalytic domain
MPSTRQLSHYGWQPADPPRQPVLFVNPRSGDGRAARAGVAEQAREQGIEVVLLSPGQDLAALARAAAAVGADALGMAGGDGSLAIVAATAAAHGIPFVCVPAGTRNHFALDVGVDRRDVTGALGAFTDGVERRIDVAEVNGRTFLNNVSLGVYGDAVRSPAYRDAKMRTLLETAAEVLGPSAGTRAAPPRRPGPRAPSPRRRARLEQPLRARPPAGPRHPPGTRQRPARDHRPRRPRRPPARARAGLEHAAPGSDRPGTGARRD